MAHPHPSHPDRGFGARARVIALRPDLDVGSEPPDAVTGGWIPDVRRRRRWDSSLRQPPRSAARERRLLDEFDAQPAQEWRDGRVDDHTGAMDPVAANGGASGAEDDVAPASGDDPAPSKRPAWAVQLVRRGPWGQLAERWVPEAVRGARVSPGRRGAVVLTVIAALAAVVAAVGVWWGRPSPTPVAPVTLPPVTSVLTGATNLAMTESAAGAAAARNSTSTPTPASAGTAQATTAPTAPTGPILVSVTGQVRHPGLVTVPADARVADAIAAAGGALDPDDLTGLNLAAHLSDGDSVVVAGPSGSMVDAESSPVGGAEPATGVRDTATSSPLDLNTADEAALEELPGVGPVTAAAIVSWRTDHGPFTSVDQLQAIPGIGPAKFAQISPHVTV